MATPLSLNSESGGSSTTDQYPRTTVCYKTTPTGVELTADVFLGETATSATTSATTTTSSLRPAVLWIHGGGLIFGTKAWLPKDQLERYLGESYIVVSMNHRLAPETKVPDIIQDVRDAWQWMTLPDTSARTFGIDPARIAVVGHSAGGYLALNIGTFFSKDDNIKYKPKAIVSVYGYGDVTGAWVAEPSTIFQPELSRISREEAVASLGTKLQHEVATDKTDFDPQGRPKFFFYCKQSGAWIPECFGVALNGDNYDFFAPYEPIWNMTKDYPPTLVVHGDKDCDVPVEQAVLVYEELQKHQVPVEFIRNPDWAHLFDHFPQDSTVQECLDQILVFIKRYL